MKQIVIIPELKELEMKIGPRISLLKRDFDKHYNDAIDYFYKERKLDKAMDSIQKEKEIYTTKELLDLEALIEKEIKSRRKI